MGIVYCARDLRLERVVAIKLLPPQLADAAERRNRFVREARMAAQLSHPNIVPIHAVEEVGALVFFVMSYIDGETLGSRLRREGRLKPADAARILREVAWALAYAHRQALVHRDIKPDNILLERGSSRALVADFGIARVVAAAREGDSGEGRLVGTPEYMSPEQALGEPVDGRSDLYSLGVVGYYALSGRLPFTGATATAIIGQQISQPPPPLDAHTAPPQLITAIERCLVQHVCDVSARRLHRPPRRGCEDLRAGDARAKVAVCRPEFLQRTCGRACRRMAAFTSPTRFTIRAFRAWALFSRCSASPICSGARTPSAASFTPSAFSFTVSAC